MSRRLPRESAGPRRGSGFTLLELLVAMAIVALLAAILLPVLGRAKAKYNRDFRQFLRSSDFARPSAVFLFLDEHPDTIDDGFYMIRLGRYEWSNLPASYHNGAANVSFPDGAELDASST